MKIRHNKRKGFSLIELLIVVTIILIIAAIAIPNLMRSKIQANETAAVGALKALQESTVLYSNTYGGFPHALSDLGPGAGGTAGCTACVAPDAPEAGALAAAPSAAAYTTRVPPYRDARHECRPAPG